MEKSFYLHRVLNDDSMDIARFILTRRGQILACNRMACAMFKFRSPQQLIDSDYRALVPVEFADYIPTEITIEHLTNGLYLKRVNRCSDDSLIPTLIKTSFIELEKELYVECLVKADPETNETLELIRYKQMNELLKSELMRLKNEINPSKEMTYFQHDLAFALGKKHTDLKARDMVFCSLVLAGLQTKEIADILCMTTESAYKYRKRLRKKLELSAEEDLFEYLKTVMLEVRS